MGIREDILKELEKRKREQQAQQQPVIQTPTASTVNLNTVPQPQQTKDPLSTFGAMVGGNQKQSYGISALNEVLNKTKAKAENERKKKETDVYAALLPGYKPKEQTQTAAVLPSVGAETQPDIFSGRGGSFSGSSGKIDGGSSYYSDRPAMEYWENAMREYENAIGRGLSVKDWYEQASEAVRELSDAYNKDSYKRIRSAETGLGAGAAAGEFAYMFDDENKKAQDEYNAAIAEADDLRERLAKAQQTKEYATAFLMNSPVFKVAAERGHNMYKEGATLEDGEQPNKVRFAMENKAALAVAAPHNDKASDLFTLTFLTPDEQSLYDYLLATGGTEAADAYLSEMEETLAYRQGTGLANKIDELPGLARVPVEVLSKLGGGAAQNIENLGQAFNGERRKTKAYEFTNEGISRNTTKRGGKYGAESVLTEAAGTIGNMAPAIGLGFIPIVGQALGAAEIGLSAGGGNYKAALEQGYRPDQARDYATVTGIAEGGLQYVLGGLSKLGGINQFTGALTNKIGNQFLKAGAELGFSLVGENAEEYLQNKLDAYMRNRILGENNEIKLWDDDDTYTLALTTLTTFALEGGGKAAGFVGDAFSKQEALKKVGRQWMRDGGVGDLVEAAKTSPDQNVQRLAEKVAAGRNVTEADVGKLAIAFEAAGGDLSFILDKHAKVDPQATEVAQKADEQAKTANVPAEQTIDREYGADAKPDYGDVDYDGDVAFIDRTGKTILWDGREQNHDQLIGENNWSDRYGLRQAIRDGYIRVKPGNGIELSAENGVLSAEQEEGLKKLINDFKGEKFYVDLDVDLEDGSLYPRYSTSFTGADIDFRTIANWIDKSIRSYERSVSEHEAKKTTEAAAGTREASGDIPAPPPTGTARTGDSGTLNQRAPAIGKARGQEIARQAYEQDMAKRRAARESELSGGLDVDAVDFDDGSDFAPGPSREGSVPDYQAPEVDPAVANRIKKLEEGIAYLKENARYAESDDAAYWFYRQISEAQDELNELLAIADRAGGIDRTHRDFQAPTLRGKAGDGISIKDLGQRAGDDVVYADEKKAKEIEKKIDEIYYWLDYTKDPQKRQQLIARRNALFEQLSKINSALGKSKTSSTFEGGVDNSSDNRYGGLYGKKYAITDNENWYEGWSQQEKARRESNAASKYSTTLENGKVVANSPAFADLIDTAKERIEEDPRAVSSIINGTDGFDVPPRLRADILNTLSEQGVINGDYYASGNEVVRSRYGNTENVRSDIYAEDEYDRQKRQEQKAIFNDNKAWEKENLDYKHTDDMAPPKSAQERRLDAQKKAEQDKIRNELAAARERKSKNAPENYARAVTSEAEKLAERSAGVKAMLELISKQEKAGNHEEAEALRKAAIQSSLLKGAGFGATMEASQNKGGKDNGTGIHRGTEEKGIGGSEEAGRTSSGNVAEGTGSLLEGIQQAANPGGTGENGDLRSARPYLSGNNALASLKPGVRKVAEETQRRRVAEYKSKGASVVYSNQYNETERKLAKTAEKFGASFIVMDSSNMDSNIGAVTLPGNAGIILFRKSGSKLSQHAQFIHELGHFQIKKVFGSKFGTYASNWVLNKAGIDENSSRRIRSIYQLLYANDYISQLSGGKITDFASAQNSIDPKTVDLVKEVSALCGEEIYCDLLAGNSELFNLLGEEYSDMFSKLRGEAYGFAKENKLFNDSQLNDVYDTAREDVVDIDRTVRQWDEDEDSYMRSLEDMEPPEKEAPVDENSPFEPREYDNARGYNYEERTRQENRQRYREDEAYREQRYEDKRGFDNAADYARRQRQRAEEALREKQNAENQKKPDIDTARKEFGESAYKTISDAVKSLTDTKLVTDETDMRRNSGKREEVDKFPAYKEAVDNVRKAAAGIVDGTSTFEELADAYELLNGKNNSRSKLSDSKFYSKEVASSISRVLEDIESMKWAKGEEVDRLRGVYRKDAARAIAMLSHDINARNESILLTRKANKEMSEARVKPKAKDGKVTKSVVRDFFTQQNDPRAFFKWLGGMSRKHGSTMYGFADRVNKSTSEKINTRANAEDMFRPLSEMKGYVQFATGKTKGNVTVYSDKGEVQLSMSQEVDLLKSLETRGGAYHALLNGVVLPGGEKVSLDKKTLNTLQKDLKSDVMSDPIAKNAYETSNKVMQMLRKKIAEVYERMYGVEFGGELDSYWNLKLDWDNVGKEIYNDPKSVENNPHTKKREGFKGALRVTSFNESMSRYIETMSDYIGYAELSRDLNMMNSSFGEEMTMLDGIEESFGKKAASYLETWVKGMDGNIESKHPGWAKLRSALARGSLLLNPGVAVKQTASYYNAAGVLDFDILLKNRVKSLNLLRSAKYYKNNEIIKKVDEYTGFLKDRRAGSGSIVNESAEARRDLAGTIVDKFIPKPMRNWIATQDVRTISNLAIACYEQVARDNADNADFKIGSEAHYKETAALLERVVLETQPVYETNARAEYLRDKDEAVRSMAMFRTQPTQNFNSLFTAIGEYKAAKQYNDAAEVKAARSKLANVLAGQFMSSAAYAVLQGIGRSVLHKLDDYKDDEGNFTIESMAKRLGLDALEVAAGTVWFGDTASKLFVDVLTGDKTDEFWDVSNGVVDLFASFGKSLKSFAGDVSKAIEEDEPIKLKTVQKLVDSFTRLGGIPEGNAYKLVNSAVLYVMDVTKSNPDKFTDVLEYIDNQGRRRHSESADAVFNALAASGVSVSDAVRFYNEIDVDTDKNGKTNGQLSQNELFNWNKAHPEQEKFTKVMWQAMGFSTTWEDYKAEHELDDGKYVETRESLTKAMNKKTRDYDELDELLSKDGAYNSLSDEAKKKMSSVDQFNRLLELHEAGFSSESAFEIIDMIDDLEPEKGKSNVSQEQKADAIIDSDLTTKEKLKALKAYTSDSYYEDMTAVLDTGVSLEKWSDVHNAYSKINADKSLTPYQKGDKFFSILDKDTSLKPEQREVIKDVLAYYSMNKVGAENYTKLTKLKMKPDVATKVADAMRGIEEQDDRVDKILSFGLDVKDQWRALKVYTDESFYEKAEKAYIHGVDLDDYVRMYRDADTPNYAGKKNGSLSQEELWNFYKKDPKNNEKFVAVMWMIIGTSQVTDSKTGETRNNWKKTWEEYKKSQK